MVWNVVKEIVGVGGGWGPRADFGGHARPPPTRPPTSHLLEVSGYAILEYVISGFEKWNGCPSPVLTFILHGPEKPSTALLQILQGREALPPGLLPAAWSIGTCLVSSSSATVLSRPKGYDTQGSKIPSHVHWAGFSCFLNMLKNPPNPGTLTISSFASYRKGQNSQERTNWLLLCSCCSWPVV